MHVPICFVYMDFLNENLTVSALNVNQPIIQLKLLCRNTFQTCDTKSLLSYILTSFVAMFVIFVNTMCAISCSILLDLLIGH